MRFLSSEIIGIALRSTGAAVARRLNSLRRAVPTIVAAVLFAAAAAGQTAGQPPSLVSLATRLEQEGKFPEAASAWREVVKFFDDDPACGRCGDNLACPDCDRVSE